MYVARNTELRACNNCCSGKAVGIKYYEFVFVALGTQQAMRKCHIVICGLSGSVIIFIIIL